MIGNPNIQPPQKGGWLKNMIPAIAGALPIVGGVAQGVIAGMNTRAANKYNSPVEQIKRAKAAHLPAASINNISAGNQSAVTPSTDFGTASAGKEIGQYNHNQKTLKEIGRLTEDIHKMKLENTKLAKELEWYTSPKGTPGTSNLTYGLQVDQGIRAAQKMGQDFANKIAGANAGNIGYKIRLDNIEQNARIANAIQNNIGEGVKIEGYRLDNAMKEIAKEWTPKMNKANLDNILQRNDILTTEKGLKELELELGNATKRNVITRSNVESALAQLGLEQFGTNYKFNKEYQKIASKARELVNKETTSLSEFGDQLGAWIFTTFSDFTGGGKMPNLPNLGDQSKTFNTYNSSSETRHIYHND